MTNTTWLRRLVLLCGTWALLAVPASANTIVPVFVSAVGTTWTYTINVIASQLQNGDYVTINDFGTAGLISNPAPADWAFSQSSTGPNSLPTPETGKKNITLMWTGGTVNVGFASYTFVFSSANGSATKAGRWSSQDHQIGTGLGPQPAGGFIQTPLNPVPDGGSTIALLGMTLVAVAGLRRKMNL